VYDEVIRTVPGAEVYSVGSAKHKVQLERHEAVNRAIDRFIRNQRRSWRGPSERAELIERRPWLLNYSYNTPYTIPLPRQSLHHFLEGAATWVPRRTALIFYGTHLTYQQLNAQVNQFAHALGRRGVQPGDRVMVVLPNVPQMIIAYYAILKIGAVVVLPNPDADADNIVEEIQHTNARIFITLTAFDTLAQTVREKMPEVAVILADLRHVIAQPIYRQLSQRWGSPTFDEDPDVENPYLGQIMAEIMADEPETDPNIEIPGSNLAVIVYTSGTTDEPRSVGLTHNNLVANALQTRHWISDLEYGREVFLSVLPLMHCYGMTTAMNLPVALGAAMVLLPVFDLDQVLSHIKIYRPTIFPGVPSMYTAINHAPHVRSYGLAAIKACISGAAPLPVEVQEEFEKLTRGRLIEGYGLTEASPITHANPVYGARKVGTIGVPLPNTDAKIIDLATGVELQPGEIGELIVRGPQVMRKPWNNENESIVKDGWLYTGDIAVTDADGYFQILGRKRDTIMVGSYYVYPRDVEEVLYENSKVLEAAVVGVPNADNGQKVKAIVVPRHGATLSKEELLDLCRRRLDDYAIPTEIEFRKELPKSYVGKVVRRWLVEEEK
jgi:long-chain acyl-CoA synthetase